MHESIPVGLPGVQRLLERAEYEVELKDILATPQKIQLSYPTLRHQDTRIPLRQTLRAGR